MGYKIWRDEKMLVTSPFCFSDNVFEILLKGSKYQGFFSKKVNLLPHSHTMTPIDAPGKQAF